MYQPVADKQVTLKGHVALTNVSFLYGHNGQMYIKGFEAHCTW